MLTKHTCLPGLQALCRPALSGHWPLSIGWADLFHGCPEGCGLAPLGLLFQYLGLLRQASPQRWVFEELAATAAMRFRFAEEEDPCDFVTRLAEDAPYYAPEHILQGSYLYDQWEPKLVRRGLGQGSAHMCCMPDASVAMQRPARCSTLG